MAELQLIIVFHSRHFVRHLGICNRICVNLLQLMSGVITHNSVKNGLHINKWLSYGQLVFHGRQFVRHLGICNQICVKLLQVMSGFISSNLKKKRRLYFKLFSPRSTTRQTHARARMYARTHARTHTIE